MIAHLRGTLLEKHPNQAIVDVGGVGYDVQISVSTYTSLPDTGQIAAFRIFTHVREDSLQLFGFASQEEKQLFEKLITISGIGPKLAVTVLSGLGAKDLINALRTGDLARLVRIPGVGRKTAERMVLELKDKLAGIDVSGPIPEAASTMDPLDRDVLSALLNLGCARPAAEDALRKVKERGEPQEFEALFRASLSQLALR